MRGVIFLVLFLLIEIKNGSTQTSTKNERDEQSQNSQYRLSRKVIPQYYWLTVTPNLEESTFSGHVKIKISVEQATTRITLHSKNLTIDNHLLKRNNVFIRSDLTFDEENDFLIITSSKELKSNSTYNIYINFKGVIHRSSEGFFTSSYIINGKTRKSFTTQFEEIGARKAFPCFDEPQFRTPFRIQVNFTHAENYWVISNMPKAKHLPHPKGSKTHDISIKFLPTPPMSTYLVSWAIFDHNYYKNVTKSKITIWIRNNISSNATFIRDYSLKILQVLENYLDFPYHLPKLDIIIIPELSVSGMENWGMITLSERIVINENQCDKIREYLMQTISHEIAHQWFGNLLTPAWWQFRWLKEGFATYLQYVASAKVAPEWNFNEVFVIEELQSTLKDDIFAKRAMNNEIKTSQDIGKRSQAIDYSKSACIIRMLEHMISPEKFQKALRIFLKNSTIVGSVKYNGSVTPSDLYKALNEQMPRVYDESSSIIISFLEIIERWVNNTKYPLITVVRDYENNLIHVNQSTYRKTKRELNGEWIVPLTYTTKSKPNFINTKPNHWSFANETLSIRCEERDWIIFNIQQTGYYRVNYDLRNWNLLIAQLHRDPFQIHILNRAQIVNEAITLADDSLLSYDTCFRLVAYLSKETELLPWLSAIPSFNLWYKTSEGYPFQEMISKFFHLLIANVYDKFKWNNPFMNTRKSSWLQFACRMGYKKCSETALELYRINEKNLTNIELTLKEVIYCETLRSSNDTMVFDNLWKEYQKTDIAEDKTTILKSLSCIRDGTTIRKILLKIADPQNEEITAEDMEKYLASDFFNTMYVVNATIGFLEEKLLHTTNPDQYEISALVSTLVRARLESQMNRIENLANKLDTYGTKFEKAAKDIRDVYSNAKINKKYYTERAVHLESNFQNFTLFEEYKNILQLYSSTQ